MEKLQQSFATYLDQQNYRQAPERLYEPINYIFGLGGKRIRPLLVLLGNALFAKNTEEALPAAYAVELFHNFSLLHDDIMDEAPLRRGQPAVHIKYGTNTGILSGDVMLVYVYEYLLKCPRAIDLVARFNQVAIEVCEGQQYDMDFETAEVVEIAEYLRMIELKTAALLGGALELGALIGGASEKDTQELRAFGRKIGIAFQLQDDILDTFGDPEKFGKRTGGDIVQNKKTFLVLKALAMADEAAKIELLNLYNPNTIIEEAAKIEQVKRIFLRLNVREEAELVMERHYQEAMEHLDAVSIDPDRKRDLRGLAKGLMQREE